MIQDLKFAIRYHVIRIFPCILNQINPRIPIECVCAVGKKALVPNVVSYSGVINACSTDSWRTSTELLQRMSQEAPCSGMAGSLKSNDPIGDTPIFIHF